MKRLIIAVGVLGLLTMVQPAFALDGQVQSNETQNQVSDEADEILVDVNAENMDEGYGSDEEYFGAEVNGFEDDYIDDEDLMVNAEEENIENDSSLDEVANVVAK